MTGLELCLAASMVLSLGTHQKNTLCKYSEYIIQESRKKEISPILTVSLIFHESSFRSRAVSSAGACGLTQVIPEYSRYTCEELKQPRISIREGLKHLKVWLTRAKGDEALALCGYNAGNKCFTDEKFKKRVIKKYSRKIIDSSKKLNENLGYDKLN